MKCLGTFIIGLAFTSIVASAQTEPELINDSTYNDAPIISPVDQEALDNAELIEMYALRFNPRRAGLYSAVFPGLGQAYNKKYWKIPIIYGGIIGLSYGIDFYQKEHKKFRNELFEILKTDAIESESGLSEDQLRTFVDKTRRERDYFMILTGILYLLNIVDAHIDAHLKEFDLNDKLKLTFDPMIQQQNQLQAGLSIGLNFH
jgi:hypothetical protein